jgi:hypothetical protein
VRPPRLAAATTGRRSPGADRPGGRSKSLTTRGLSMNFYLIVRGRKNRHYCTAVLLPSSVPLEEPRLTPRRAGFFVWCPHQL